MVSNLKRIFHKKSKKSKKFIIISNYRSLIKRRFLTFKKFWKKLVIFLRRGFVSFKLIFFRYTYVLLLKYLYKNKKRLKLKKKFFFKSIFAKIVYFKLSRSFIKRTFLTNKLGYLFSLSVKVLVKDFFYVNKRYITFFKEKFYVILGRLNTNFFFDIAILFKSSISPYVLVRFFNEAIFFNQVRLGLLFDSSFDYFSNILRDKLSFTYINPFLLNYVFDMRFVR